MKFLFSSCSSTPEPSGDDGDDFHKNLINGMLKNATRYDDDDDDTTNASDRIDSDLDCQGDDEDNYMIDDEENETEYNRELEKNSKRFKLKQLSLPLSGIIYDKNRVNFN